MTTRRVITLRAGLDEGSRLDAEDLVRQVSAFMRRQAVADWWVELVDDEVTPTFVVRSHSGHDGGPRRYRRVAP